MNINTMNRNINNLIQISWSVNNLFKQSSYVIMKRLIHTTQYNLQNEDDRRRKFSVVESKKSLFSNRETFVNELKNCTNHKEVFSKIQQRTTDMTAEEAVLVISKLFDLNKKCLINPNIIESSEFNTLCEILTNNMRSLSTNNIINTLRSLIYLNVPSSTVIVQKLLQLIRESINHLLPEQAVYLIYLLPKLNKTPLVEALIIALPLVLETTVKTKLNTDSIKSMIGVLTYFSEQNTVNEDILKYIINCLNISLNQSNYLSSTDALNTLFSLLKLDSDFIPMELISTVHNVLIEQINQQKPSILGVVIHKISNIRSSKNRNIFYNVQFIDVCIKRILSGQPELQEAFRLMTFLNRLFHSNTELIDYVMDKCIKTQYFSENDNITERMVLITAITRGGQKPSSWELLQDSLLVDNFLYSKFYVMLELTIHLLSLDCYWPQLIEKVFNSCSNEYMERIVLKRKMIILHHTVKNFYPQYYGPFLPNEDAHFSTSLFERREINTSLKTTLESIFGGRQYVMVNLPTEYGLCVDFGVIMRKGGYPVAVNNLEESKPLSLKSIEVPKDGQIFLFMCLRRREYSPKSHDLILLLRLFEKLLEIDSNHTVINIFNDEWLNLLESARLKYLTDLIKQKVNQLETMNVTC